MPKIFNLLVVFSLLAAPVAVSAQTTTPVHITIPHINVSAPIQSRGVTSRNVMLPPTTAGAVAWNNHTVLPGQPGTAVMYGHLTDVHFRPAVFANLHKLRVKDKVIVTDSHRRQYTFVVTKMATYSSTGITSTQLMPPTRFSHLTLYTCAGVWVPKLGKYSKYLVVYTTLQSVKKL